MEGIQEVPALVKPLICNPLTKMTTLDTIAFRLYRNLLVPQEVDLNEGGVWVEWWARVGGEARSLGLHSAGMGDQGLMALLTPCVKLRTLNLNGARGLFREG